MKNLIFNKSFQFVFFHFLFLLIPILILFQNCSSNQEYKIIQFNIEGSGSGSGNGAGYGGKLGAIYAQYIPKFNCEGQENPLKLLNIESSQTTLVENNEFKCNYQATPLNQEVLDISSLQSEVLGYGMDIFVRKSTPTGTIPERLVEIWCRDFQMPNSFEFIGSYNQNQQSTFSDEYFAQPNLPIQRLQQTSISRKIEDLRIYYESDTYSLIVDKSLLSTRPGQYHGTYFDKIKQISKQVDCRTGGYLDARIWPAQNLFSVPVNSYKISPDSKKVYSKLNLVFQKIFVTSFDATGFLNTLLAPFSLFDVWFVPNSNLLLVKAAPNNNQLKQLYSIQSDGTQLRPLSADITGDLQSLREEVVVSEDGQYAYYKDGSQDPSADEGWLRKVSLTTGAITQFGFQKNGADLGVYDYVFVKSKNKICYIAGGIFSDLYCTHLDGTNTQKIQFSFTQDIPDYSLLKSESEVIFWYADLQLTDDGQYLKIDSSFYNHSIITTYLVDVDTYQIRRLPDASPFINTQIQTINNYWIKPKNSTLAIRNLQTFVETETSIPETAVVSSSGNAIALLPNNDLQYYYVLDLSIHKKLCHLNNTETPITLKWMDAENFLMVSKSINDHRIFIYTGNASKGCQLRNSSIHNIARVEAMKLGQTGKSIVLQIVDDKGVSNLLWIPLNGKPIVQVTIPVNDKVIISSFDFANDDQNLIFTSDLFIPFQKMIFLFQLPTL